MSDLIVAIGLVFVIEGLVYALFPAAMRSMVVEITKMPDNAMRWFGIFVLSLGVFIVWLIRG